MVNPVVRSYMELQTSRYRLLKASAGIDAAYELYQQALSKLGPFPQQGWATRALAAREDALAGAIEEFALVVGELGAALSTLPRRPPF